ncbi:sulfite exporter TauE/SafE family protein [Edwardsiella ictaluri]|uniref:sulfite exporter TauE/SafE family protein n=1 Tax=Edwardsiella ictaluri TaxID=67780 RepID=UPI0037845E0B
METLLLSPELLGVLFCVALFAGFIDAIAGGGGLLTVPALLAVRLPPAQALATNKLQSVGGSFSSSLYFIRRRVVNLAEQKWVILLTFLAAAVGALLVQRLQAEILRQLLPFLVIGVGLYFLLTPSLGATEGIRRVGMPLFAVLGGASVGFYDGFFGPGAGSFYALGYVMLLGLSLPQATAHAKVLNFTSNAASLLLFIIGGNVVWSVGLCMLVGQAIGARVGARMVLTRGQQLIRPMIVVMSLIMSIKLLYDNHGSDILAWVQRWL